jgi:cytochrome c oxidase subunit III
MLDPVAHAAEPAEHFESVEQQEHAAHFGMWLFLTSETLLFGALFGLYTGYRLQYSEQFHEAARHNNTLLGTTNTLILVTSSFFAAWAVHALRLGRNKTAVRSLGVTLILGAGFLVIKAMEYRAHFAEGIYPGSWYHFAELPTHGAQLFFTLYYCMTGLHAAHVIGGLTTLAIIARLTAKGHYTPERHTSLELGVLYWHLVDVIWIFLWPLMYLAGG